MSTTTWPPSPWPSGIAAFVVTLLIFYSTSQDVRVASTKSLVLIALTMLLLASWSQSQDLWQWADIVLTHVQASMKLVVFDIFNKFQEDYCNRKASQLNKPVKIFKELATTSQRAITIFKRPPPNSKLPIMVFKQPPTGLKKPLRNFKRSATIFTNPSCSFKPATDFEIPWAVFTRPTVTARQSKKLSAVNLSPSQTCDFMTRLPLEMRLKIYGYALPVDIFFRGRPDDPKQVALLSTCKAINREAYAVFVAQNNFQVGPPSVYGRLSSTHEFAKHVREVTFSWSLSKGKDLNEREGPSWNTQMVKGLLDYPKLQKVNIVSYWRGVDLKHKDEGLTVAGLERIGLTVLLDFPALTKIVLKSGVYEDCRDKMRAMGEYMTERLKHPKPARTKEQIVARLEKIYGIGEEDEMRKAQELQYV